MGELLLREPSSEYSSNCEGSKIFAQHVLGIFAEFDEPCLWLVESKESSPVDAEEIKIKIDDGVDTLLRRK